jgi:hypothetical protein
MPDRREPYVVSPRSLNPLLRVLVLSVLLFAAASVRAATVAIVRPAGASPDLSEMLFRLHGELLSVGLDVEFTERRSGRGLGKADWRASLQEVAAELGARAVIEIVGDLTPLAIDVWILEPSSLRLEVARVALDPNTKNGSERLAIRAVEVLRSSLLELDLAARERHGDSVANLPLTPASRDEGDNPQRHAERVGLALGVAALTSLDGVGPAILPIVRLDWAARSRLVVHAALAGLGSRPTVATTAASAHVVQQYGVLGGRYRFRSEQWLRPFLGLAAGVLHTAVEGQADLPKQGHTVNQWSFLLDGSLGTELRLRGRYQLTLAAHVQVAEPYVAIHLVDPVVASSGRPNLLLTLTIGAWL